MSSKGENIIPLPVRRSIERATAGTQEPGLHRLLRERREMQEAMRGYLQGDCGSEHFIDFVLARIDDERTNAAAESLERSSGFKWEKPGWKPYFGND